MDTAASFQSNEHPRIAITLGDPAGIGPEVVLKTLARFQQNTVAGSVPDLMASSGADLTVVGARAQLVHHYQVLKQQALTAQAPDRDLWNSLNLEAVSVLDVPMDRHQAAQIEIGQGNAASGAASFAALQRAIDGTVAGEFDAIVTAPIAKMAWKAAGHHYPGQTELLAAGAGVDQFGMLFVAQSPHCPWTLKTLLATTHIPLCEVSQTLTPALMSTKLALLIQWLKHEFGVDTPRIAIPGLNPHSGEQGQLGREEVDWLIPWLETQRQQYPAVTLDGPIPPDTLWVAPGQAWYGRSHHPAHDAYLALYHDQGLIPLKLLAFDRAVNTTIGLPFVRTSPDHGTAFDIAGQGIADATSMEAALELAIDLSRRRSAAVIA